MESVEISQTQPSSSNQGLVYGLIGGGISVVLAIVVYIIDKELVFNWVLATIPLIISLVVGILAAVAKKRANKGYLTFGHAFVTSLLAYSISLLIPTLFTIVLMHFIDPSLLDIAVVKRIELIESLRDSNNLSDAQYKESLEKVKNINLGDELSGGLLNFVLFVIFGAIVSLISSAIIKREGARY